VFPAKPIRSPLDPIDRVSEVLFGLIMVLTSTSTLSVATAGRAEIRTMIIGALGCNLAWGIIDAALYLLGCVDERARSLQMVRTVRQTDAAEVAKQAIANELPELLAAALSQREVDALRQKLLQLPEPPPSPSLTKDDALRAVGICLWVFASTFPVVVPFFFIDSVQPALRLSNAVAIAMLFLCGYAFARCTGLRAWPTALAMVAIGCAMVGVAVALGG
jgi:VIT family